MEIIDSSRELQKFLHDLRRENRGDRLALSPTMGCLHQGHLSLFQRARELAQISAVSIFVNPLQFNNAEDYRQYPVNEKQDLELCRQSGVDLLFLPPVEDIYPAAEPALQLTMPTLTRNLCAVGRPGHFQGVMLIVARLLYLFDPDIALFGQKDHQQYLIIKELVRSLALPVEIVAIDTVRESSGLALSSRNARLSSSGRESASLIYRALKMGYQAYLKGERQVEQLIEIAGDVIRSGSCNEIEYLSIVHPETLEELTIIEAGNDFLIATAVLCDGVRLIDNLLCHADGS